jgi:hypothetical protein
MRKIFHQKNFNNFVGTPLGSRVNTYIHFCLQVSLIPAAILPPASLTPVANLPPVSLIPVANLPPVSLIPVVNLELRISPRIFEKIRNGPNGLLRGLGETDS